MIKLQYEQNTSEWLDMRKKHLGASDAPVIMGESPYKTQYELWEEKVGIRENIYYSPAMKRGHDLEGIARAQFESAIGKKYIPAVVKHAEKDFMIASLDGLAEDEKSILEIKCPNYADHELAKKGQVPVHYFAQMQHQLACCNLEFGYYFSFDGEQGCIVGVYRDASYIAEMIEKEDAFIKCVRQFCPPSLCDKDYVATCDQELVEDLLMCVSLQKNINELEKQLKKKKEHAIKRCGGLNTIADGIKLSKIVSKGRIDYDAVMKHYGIESDLSQFRKPSTESWRIIA